MSAAQVLPHTFNVNDLHYSPHRIERTDAGVEAFGELIQAPETVGQTVSEWDVKELTFDAN